MNTTAHWKSEIADLRTRARAVTAPSADVRMSARAAAACLSGVIALVSKRWSVDVMQRACAELVRHDAAWKTSFGNLPRGASGAVAEPVEMIAVVARGILPLACEDSMRAALAFWASESDPAEWQRVTGVAA
jgi:hypothetical protein